MDMLYHFSPLAILVAFVATALYNACQIPSSTQTHTLSKCRTWLASLSSAITTSFVIRAVNQTTYLSADTQSAYVHTLSQSLLWLTLSLALISISSTPTLPYLVTWLLSLVVEVSILVISYVLSHYQSIPKVPRRQLALQSVTIVLNLLLVASGLAALITPSRLELTDETQSLLPKTLSSYANSATESHSDYGSQSEADTDDQEADDKELKAVREQRLRQHGSWTSYLSTFKIFIPYVIPTRGLRLQLYVVVLILNLLLLRIINILTPFQLGRLIDNLQKTGHIPWANAIFWITLEILSTWNCGLGGINDLIYERLAAWSLQEINLAAFDKVMSLSMNFHDSKESGEIIRAIEQAGSLSSLFRMMIEDIVPGILDTFIAIWYVGHLIDVYASHIVLAVLIAFVFIIIHCSGFIVSSRRINSAAEREESKVLYETIGNWTIVSYFNRRAYESKRLATVLQAVARSQVRQNDIFILAYGLQELTSQLGRFAISILAMYRISVGTSSVGSFVALQNYWETITRPLYNLGWSYRTIANNMVDAERLMQLFETEVTIKDRPNAYTLDASRGGISFRDVKFAYESRADTLSNLNFEARPGQTIAFVGETGSGKSTIFKLLMRFYDISSGKITIDGQNVADVTLSSLREVFGFVPQDSVLFNMTILDNVRYGRLDAILEEVHDACRAACIHDKIISFPDGYMSKVGERGVKLSGGERQRIAIARVLLRNPQIVLLDEATSAMDSQTESKIQEALRRLVKGRTALVIAHRLSTIVQADKILVLDGGKIIEQGTHTELLQANGRYLDLWTKQSAQEPGTESVETPPES